MAVTGRLGKAFQVNLTAGERNAFSLSVRCLPRPHSILHVLFYLFAGAAAFCGLRIFSRSLYSSADHILSLDGSTLQKELANMFVFSSQLHSLDEHFWFVQ